MPEPPPQPQKKRRRQVMLPGNVSKHNPKDKSAELSDGLRRLKKMRVVNLNQQIAEHTKQKDLGAATACFKRAEELGVANDFTYTNLINCHVRCGDVGGASKLLKRMRREGLQPGVIAYTTVIKGHADRGDLARVELLLHEMAASAPPIELNVRTVNTCLRGCALIGAVGEVQPMLARMRAGGVVPDGSTLEYSATLLCQGLRVDEARPLLATLAAADDHVATAAARLGLSRAALLLGQWTVARKEIKAFEKSLDAIQKADEQQDESGGDDEDSDAERMAEDDDVGAGGGGGRRGMKGAAGRERSAVAFNSHRVAEWRREAAALRVYLNRASEEPDAKRKQAILAHFRQVFYFPMPTESRMRAGLGGQDAETAQQDEQKRAGKAAAAEVAASVCERLGADIALPDMPLAAWSQTAERCFDDAGCLDFSQVFGHETEAPAGDRPVHLEVGSGGGEWACAQAAASPDVDWVTLELRSDRVYHTFLNCVFGGVPNLAALGGDVHAVAGRLRPSSLSAIFVNHPEPPQQYDDGSGGEAGTTNLAACCLLRPESQTDLLPCGCATCYTGGGKKSDGEHMLTPKFFAAAYRSLEPGGRLTIVTDNQYYAKLLLQSVGALSSGGTRHFLSFQMTELQESQGKDTTGLTVEETSGEVMLYRGQPGPACGHAVVASSYFDRLWKTGASKSASASARWLLVLRREGQTPGRSPAKAAAQAKSSPTPVAAADAAVVKPAKAAPAPNAGSKSASSSGPAAGTKPAATIETEAALAKKKQEKREKMKKKKQQKKKEKQKAKAGE